MNEKKQGHDIINDVLEECIAAYPISSFVISLYKQYRERGSLSKKQLQGLHGKATKIKDISPGKLATLEAVINRMPTRDKSPLPPPKPMYEKEESTGELIDQILAKYPQHKRVLFLQSKYNNNEPLSAVEITELKRFKMILSKGS
jgi:NH3-dependent NAD+ synthetase